SVRLDRLLRTVPARGAGPLGRRRLSAAGRDQRRRHPGPHRLGRVERPSFSGPAPAGPGDDSEPDLRQRASRGRLTGRCAAAAGQSGILKPRSTAQRSHTRRRIPVIAWDGAAYEAYIGRWSRLVAREFLSWLAVLVGARWLDVGCGTGALCSMILEDTSPAEVV